MNSYNLADAKARLSELIDRAAAGEEIEIKKRGEPVVKLVAISKPRQPLDVDALQAATDRMTYHGTSATELIREMRDSRY